MKRKSAGLVTIVFFFLAPGTVAILVPWVITRWQPMHPVWDPLPLRAIGLLFIAAGAIALVDCFYRFAREGRGTPAPLYPTERLVVTGPYRFVRNPMYVSVLGILIGQALWFGNVPMLIYTGGAWLVTHFFVCLYEEPTLRRSYGSQYDQYGAHVRRWLPRLTPWKGTPAPS